MNCGSAASGTSLGRAAGRAGGRPGPGEGPRELCTGLLHRAEPAPRGSRRSARGGLGWPGVARGGRGAAAVQRRPGDPQACGGYTEASFPQGQDDPKLLVQLDPEHPGAQSSSLSHAPLHSVDTGGVHGRPDTPATEPSEAQAGADGPTEK